MKRQKQKAERINQRVDVAPEGGLEAMLGFYTPPVRRVWAKWVGQIEEERLKHYFIAAATAVISHENQLDLPGLIPPGHWQPIFELGSAVCAVCNKKSLPAAWAAKEGTLSLEANVSPGGEPPQRRCEQALSRRTCHFERIISSRRRSRPCGHPLSSRPQQYQPLFKNL